MIVTDIIAINNKKCKIFLDDQFAFALYKGELQSYQIKKDCPIGQKEYEEILHKLLPKRAILRAMNLLKERSYTRYQLLQKLKEGFYPQDCIDTAIDYVESYGYINDRQYAMDFITYRSESLNRMQIRQKLLKKGIDAGLIEEVFETFYQEGNEIEEERQILSFLNKKSYFQQAEEKERQKILAALMRKGYRYEQICSVIRSEEEAGYYKESMPDY